MTFAGINLTADYSIGALLHGHLFVADGRVTVTAGTSLDFLIRTDGVDVMIVEASVISKDQEVEVYGFSGSSVSSAGTPVSLICTDRRNNTSAQTTLYSATTVTATGTQVTFDTIYASGSGKKTSLASGGIGGVFLLAKNSDNIFRVTNPGAADADITFHLKLIEDEI